MNINNDRTIKSYCQDLVRIPKVQSPKVKIKRTWADTIITLATTPFLEPNYFDNVVPLAREYGVGGDFTHTPSWNVARKHERI